MSVATRTEPLELLVLSGDGEQGLDPSRWGELSAKVSIIGHRSTALGLLRKQGKHARVQRPALVLIDVGQQGEQGWALLREIKRDPKLRRTPVILLGASDTVRERARAYDLGANSYLARPPDEASLTAFLEQMKNFWLGRVRLPG